MKKTLSLILCSILLCLTSCDQFLLTSQPQPASPAQPQSITTFDLVEKEYTPYDGTVTIWRLGYEKSAIGSRITLKKRIINGYGAGVLARAFLGLESLEEVPQEVDALSDRPFEYFTAETMPAEAETYFISLDNEDRLYRLHDAPVLVEDFLGKGQAWSPSDDLLSLVSNTFTYWPRNSYDGTFKEKKASFTQRLEMPAPLEILVTDLWRVGYERGRPIDEITLIVRAKQDLDNIEIEFECQQSHDVVGCTDIKTVSLKKGEQTKITLRYTGMSSYYRLYITAPQTRIDLLIWDSYF
ncbi:MAG: hypothetical protein IJX08_07115 [Clostridia bacterium]|nr:hypothetical protein [Clostridia bacterium]